MLKVWTPWQVGLIAVIVIRLGLIIFGALWDRSRNRHRQAEMLPRAPNHPSVPAGRAGPALSVATCRRGVRRPIRGALC